MSNPLIIHGGPSLNREDIRRFEHRVGRTIPPSYHGFLLTYNGGTPARRLYLPIRNEPPRNEGILEWFLGITNDHLSLMYYLKTFGDRIPKNTFPIGYDPGGNLFVMVTDGLEQGAVYFWEHEEESEDEPYWDNLYFVAPNLKILLDYISFEELFNRRD